MSPLQELFPPGTDLSLVTGNAFHCRPDCGLCCFASPAVASKELEGLLKAAPGLPMVGNPPARLRIPSRAGGGACSALSNARCTAYAGRPSPCRTFPLHTHLGLRPQLSLVLSCPGLSLPGVLEHPAPPLRGDGDEGLEPELAAVASALRSSPTEALLLRISRRWEGLMHASSRQGRWEEREPLQRELESAPPFPRSTDFPPRGFPGVHEPLENLPLFFEDGSGVLGLRQGPAGYQVLHFREAGGEEDRRGEFAVPPDLPALDEEARDLLKGYLRYVLRRDQFWFLAYRTLSEDRDRTLREILIPMLRQAGAHVVVRARVRGRLKGRVDGVLGASAVEEGIRAYDADLLDQPTLGSVI